MVGLVLCLGVLSRLGVRGRGGNEGLSTVGPALCLLGMGGLAGHPSRHLLQTPSISPSWGLPHGPEQSQDCPAHSPACRDASSSSRSSSSSRGRSRDRPIALLSSGEMRRQAQTSKPEGGPAVGPAQEQQERDDQPPSEDRGRVGAFPNGAMGDQHFLYQSGFFFSSIAKGPPFWSVQREP